MIEHLIPWQEFQTTYLMVIAFTNFIPVMHPESDSSVGLTI